MSYNVNANVTHCRDHIEKCLSVRQCLNRLEALAQSVRRLGPDHRNPERFHMDKSEIVAELQKLARELR